MNTPWIIGTVFAIAFFIVFERYAFNHPSRQNTLSMAIFQLGAKWPLSIFIMGMFAGGLAVHFFWHWCPPGSLSTGMLGDGWRSYASDGLTVDTHPIGVVDLCYLTNPIICPR